MSISLDEFKFEQDNLEDVKSWLQQKVNDTEEKKEKLKEDINRIKKNTSSYNVELEISKQMYEKTCNDYDKYNEAKDRPYFARIDFKEDLRSIDKYYIGKFGLYDDKNEEERVIDWRAPIADLYYSGTQGKSSYEAPIGRIQGELLLKRKFLLKDCQIADAFDEGINDIILKAGENSEENALIDEFLKINLEESVSSKLKDVVATIQKEQNDIIRADIKKPTIVQGSAGSGKTTIALHRLAYILYRYKNTLDGKDVLVVAPNRLFLDYISEVLPSLGVDEVRQITFEDLSLKLLGVKGKIYTKDEKLSYILECKDAEEKKLIFNSSKLRGDIIYKVIIDRYIRYLEKSDLNIESIKLDEYIVFEKNFIKKLYLKDLAHLPLSKRKNEIKRYLLGRVKEKTRAIEEEIELKYFSEINELKKSMKDGEERRKLLINLYDKRDIEKESVEDKIKYAVKEYFDKWNYSDILNLYYDLFRNREVFQLITEGKIPESLYNFMLNEIENNMKNNKIDADDLAALVYLYLKIYGNKFVYKHIVVDEAQDYSLFQLEVLKLMALNNSMTIVGDVGQGIYYYKGIDKWDKVIEKVFNSDINYTTVTQSYRSTVEIINFANRVLEKQKNNLKPAMPVLRHGEEPEIIEIDNDNEFLEKLDFIVEDVKNKKKSSIAIIGKDIEECIKINKVLKKHYGSMWNLIKGTEDILSLGKIIIPSHMTKGLEFDCSIVYNCSDKNYRNVELDKKLLYVALTRALHFEYIFVKGDKSPLIL